MGPIALACMALVTSIYTQERRTSRKETIVDTALAKIHYTLSHSQETLIEWALQNLPDTPKPPSRYKRKKGSKSRGRIFQFQKVLTLMPAMAMPSTLAGKTVAPEATLQTFRLDAESRIIGVDNRASKCISKHRGDFVGPLQDQDVTIQGYSGSMNQRVKKGTLRWSAKGRQWRPI